MNNSNRILVSFKKYTSKVVSSLLLAVIVTICYSSFSLSRAIAQENSDSQTTNVPENSEPLREAQDNPQKKEPVTAIRSREKSSILEAIWKLLRAKRERQPALTSRSNICEITPGLLGETNTIYSDRPLFLWQGTAPSLEIYLYSPFSLDRDQEVQWSTTLTTASQKVLYTGEALQPGQIYDWEIVAEAESNRRRIAFQVMEQGERERISEKLAQLETDLTISGATKEEIILAKANYFAEKDLWSDSLQQLYSLENSSTVVRDSNQKIVSYLCQSDNF